MEEKEAELSKIARMEQNAGIRKIANKVLPIGSRRREGLKESLRKSFRKYKGNNIMEKQINTMLDIKFSWCVINHHMFRKIHIYILFKLELHWRRISY